MTRFRYDPAVLQRFPEVVGGVIHATGVTNGPNSSELRVRPYLNNLVSQP